MSDEYKIGATLGPIPVPTLEELIKTVAAMTNLASFVQKPLPGLPAGLCIIMTDAAAVRAVGPFIETTIKGKVAREFWNVKRTIVITVEAPVSEFFRELERLGLPWARGEYGKVSYVFLQGDFVNKDLCSQLTKLGCLTRLD